MHMWTVTLLVGVILAGLVVDPTQAEFPLAYFDTDLYDERSESSSLPSRFGERVLRSPEPGEPRELPGVLIVLSKPYPVVRERIREEIHSRLSQDNYREEVHEDLVEYNEYAGHDREGYYEERRLRSQAHLETGKIKVAQYREARITSTPYNLVWWKRANSQSLFRIIDGRDVFNIPCTLVIVKRTDKELRLGFLHGIWPPIPTLGVRSRSLVTDKEIALVEQAARGLKSKWQVYPFWETSLLANAEILVLAKKALVASTSSDNPKATILRAR